MAVPKKRHTKSRRNKRRSHHALKKQIFTICPKCGSPVLPHTLCWNCGSYAGEEVIDVLSKLTKKEKKKREKEMKEREAKMASKGKELSMEELSKSY